MSITSGSFQVRSRMSGTWEANGDGYRIIDRPHVSEAFMSPDAKALDEVEPIQTYAHIARVMPDRGVAKPNRTYDPMDEKECQKRAKAFAKIGNAAGDPEAFRKQCLAFANEYGLLGTHIQIDMANDEPLEVWRRESLAFKLRIDEIQKLATGQSDALAIENILLANSLSESCEGAGGVPSSWVATSLAEFSIPMDPKIAISKLLVHGVNEVLFRETAVYTDLVVGAPIRMIPKSLLGAIYLRLALKMSKGGSSDAEARICEAEDCNNPIPYGRDRFCSKACGNRQRVRNARKNAKEKQVETASTEPEFQPRKEVNFTKGFPGRS